MIKIIAFVDSFKHYSESIKEFQKRLWKKVDFLKLKPSGKKSISEIIKEETQVLEEILKKQKWYKVLLYINGKTFDSLDFSKFLE